MNFKVAAAAAGPGLVGFCSWLAQVRSGRVWRGEMGMLLSISLLALCIIQAL